MHDNPSAICEHYHKFEEGEVCTICKHRLQGDKEKFAHAPNALPTKSLVNFLYVDNNNSASRAERNLIHGTQITLYPSQFNKWRIYEIAICIT